MGSEKGERGSLSDDDDDDDDDYDYDYDYGIYDDI